MESEERRNRSGDRSGGEAAATSLFAKLSSILCVTSTRCRERLCVYNVLDWCGIAGGLHLRRTTVLVSCWDAVLLYGVVSSALWRASERLLKAWRSSSGSAMKGLSLPGQPHRLHLTQPMSRSP